MFAITLEQESVARTSGSRELSVGARQLLEFGEFLLLVADWKLYFQRVDLAGGDRYVTGVCFAPDKAFCRKA